MRYAFYAAAICLTMCLPILASATAYAQAAQPAASGPALLLDQNSPLRRYYRFCPNRISPAVLKAESQRILDKARYDRLKQTTEKWLQSQGVASADVDWREHAVLADLGARAFNPHVAPPPPSNWASADFDDGGWVRLREPFQGGPPPGITTPVLGQYDEMVDLKLYQAFYRGRFVVGNLQAAKGITLQLTYAGGVRVFVNGQEIARGHLPEGELSPDEPGAEYPPTAYAKDGERLSRRQLGPVVLPTQHLRQGTNVLAVEIRASDFHPVVLTNPIQPNWGGPMRPWPHARLFSLELRGTGGVPGSARPLGVQVWAEDMHHRSLSSDWLPEAERPSAVRLVAAQNGSCSAQLVVGTDKPLSDVQFRCGRLQRTGGSEQLASAVQISPMVGFPVADWSIQYLGDERGLGAKFPDMQQLAQYAAGGGRVFLFDQISGSGEGVSIPANTSRPFWLRVTVPKDAVAGTYRGTIEALAGGTSLASLPLELEVVGWTLPDPKAFRTLVGCEENPYAVARQYGEERSKVEDRRSNSTTALASELRTSTSDLRPSFLWSDEHFKLLEASFQQLGRIGNQWLNVPVLTRTEFGNGGDSMIRWARKADGSLGFDYTILDRYLDLAAKHCGSPRVVHFVVMHGMRAAAGADVAPQVSVLEQATGRTVLMDVGDAAGAEGAKAWTAFATALCAHMKARGLDKSMYWGAPLEGEAEPGLKNILAQCAPGVFWTAGPHEMMYNGTFAKDEKFYRLVADIRYQGGWPSFRDDQGWKSKTLHPLNPRVGGTTYALHTTSYPFGFRVMVDRCLATGRSGFTRVGADEWAATHYAGMTIPKWLTGEPVLFVLWPGKNGAESSARFEALLEGIQEAEARISIEQTLDAGKVPAALADEARKTLARHFQETHICQGNSLIHSIEAYHYGWQDRSRRLYQIAAKLAAYTAPERR